MIFLTVGTQLAFPRLIEAMDGFAAETEEEVIAQTGADATDWPHLTVHRFLDPETFDTTFARARVIVAHAGIGTILSAKRHGRPLILVPRRHALDEHRNDHQLATARALDGTTGLYIAWETADLPELLSRPSLLPMEESLGPRHADLVQGLAGFIAQARP